MAEWEHFTPIDENDSREIVTCDDCGQEPRLYWNTDSAWPEMICKCGQWELDDYYYPPPWKPE